MARNKVPATVRYRIRAIPLEIFDHLVHVVGTVELEAEPHGCDVLSYA